VTLMMRKVRVAKRRSKQEFIASAKEQADSPRLILSAAATWNVRPIVSTFGKSKSSLDDTAFY
jgi:hypothetical protein